MLGSLGLSPSALAICIFVVIANLSNSIVGPVLPAISDYFGSSAAEVGLMVSGFGLGRLAMDLPAGFLTDRVGPTRMFAAGILMSALSSALAAFSPSLPLLTVYRIGTGVGCAIVATVALVLLANGAKPNERGKILALYTSCNLFGAALGPSLGGYLAVLFDWRAVFIFCTIASLISFPLNLLTNWGSAVPVESGTRAEELDSESKASRPDRSSGEVSRAVGASILVVYFSTFLAFFHRLGMLSTLLPLYAGSVLGMDPLTIGGILSSRAIFTIFVTLPGGTLADRIGKKAVLIPSLLIVAAGNLYLLTGENMAVFTISTFMLSMSALSTSLLSAMLADLLRGRSVGKAMGMFRFVGDLGMVAGPFAVGLIVDHSGYVTSSLFAASVILLSAVGCGLLPRRTAQPRAREAARS